MYFRESGDGAEENIFYAWLGRGCDGYSISIATETRRNPEDVNFFYGWRPLSGSAVRSDFCRHGHFPLRIQCALKNKFGSTGDGIGEYRRNRRVFAGMRRV
jgi:hypothetical protein